MDSSTVMAMEPLSARSHLLPTRTVGTLPTAASISGIQKASRLLTVSGRERSPTSITPWAPLRLAVLILEYSFCPRMSHIIILRLMIRLGFVSCMSFFETFVPMVAMYLSSNLLTTYLAVREVFPTAPSPSRTTFFRSSLSSIQERNRR